MLLTKSKEAGPKGAGLFVNLLVRWVSDVPDDV